MAIHQANPPLAGTRSATSLRCFDIAEAVARATAPMTLEQIAKQTNTPRSTLHRITKQLVEAKVLMLEPKGKHYSAGERLIALTRNIDANDALHSERRAVLQLLVDQLGETCNFTTLDITDVVYVDRVEAKWPLRLHLEPGSRVPLHCTSSGKLFLSHMPAGQRRRLLYEAPLTRYTPKTITDPDVLAKELTTIRRANLSTDDEGYLRGLISVAVPVFGRNRRVIGTVAVHALKARMDLPQALEHATLLRRAAGDLGSIYRRFGMW